MEIQIFKINASGRTWIITTESPQGYCRVHICAFLCLLPNLVLLASLPSSPFLYSFDMFQPPGKTHGQLLNTTPKLLLDCKKPAHLLQSFNHLLSFFLHNFAQSMFLYRSPRRFEVTHRRKLVSLICQLAANWHSNWHAGIASLKIGYQPSIKTWLSQLTHVRGRVLQVAPIAFEADLSQNSTTSSYCQQLASSL